MRLAPFDPRNATHRAALVQMWNAACGDDLALNQRLVTYNIQPTPGVQQVGQLALDSGAPVGFVLASTEVAPDATLGWIEALAVEPSHQRHGAGGALLRWAEAWLVAHRCPRIRLGGSLRPFVAGLPVTLGTQPFFERHGYRLSQSEWDVAHHLSRYQPLASRAAAGRVRPAEPADLPALDAFLACEFPGRWHFEFREFQREAGRASDYVLLLVENAIAGFARLTLPDSERPIERFYMHRLPQPWGQLGPIGVSAVQRGHGYGAMLLDGALLHLRALGVEGCVIDWTSLLDFYRKFGFEPYREYAILVKDLEDRK
jgi:predicted N-acetyltransferase YhbS